MVLKVITTLNLVLFIHMGCILKVTFSGQNKRVSLLSIHLPSIYPLIIQLIIPFVLMSIIYDVARSIISELGTIFLTKSKEVKYAIVRPLQLGKVKSMIFRKNFIGAERIRDLSPQYGRLYIKNPPARSTGNAVENYTHTHTKFLNAELSSYKRKISSPSHRTRATLTS